MKSNKYLHTHSESDDGLCIIQPLLKAGATNAKASGLQIAGAAWRILQECNKDGSLQGGVANDIGN